ncbi:YicC/YloC family endoribonuclease [Puniceicoccus vermicola]|uniref:YicC family protein n=1 Tax=Puniceicoccus vermicola TaxID=388746 RepID=A0A7X1E3Z4_9BACT|nr:YicC/YloC family endoribonuclease [Puniceicoccus vermicola]MBC2601489.1 YicC family protein [Puniceicoccus vermicola]
MNSMTGYGSGNAGTDTFHVEAELHSVNQRGLQVQVHAPREWGGLDTEISNWLRERVTRGKFNVSLRFSRASEDGTEGANWEEVDKRVKLLRKAMFRHQVEEPITPDVLYRILSDSDRESSAPEWEPVKDTVFSALEEAGQGLLAMRAEEGKRLREEFALRAGLLREALQKITDLDEGRTIHHRDALLSRLRQMDLDLDLSDERVAKELAFLADRSDISEETARIDSHLTALNEALDADEPIGRKIEFLLQELHREFNTVGSKASLSELSAVVIEAKQELEKLREQAANVE